MSAVLHQVPCLADNYAYLVVTEGGRAFAVDPPEAAPVLERLASLGATLVAVVNTHHHGDHTGGNLDLVAATGCEVVGAAHDRARIPGLTRAVEIGAHVVVAGLELRVLDVRAHTRAHVAYALAHVDRVERWGHGGAPAFLAALADRPALFVGDALFAGGCGRLFEGTPADLERALRTLAAEDPRSLVVCAHEYTASNLRFAVSALPDNAAIRARAEGLDDERAGTRSSVPSTLAEELRTNPFLLALHDADPVRAVGEMRAAKDAAR